MEDLITPAEAARLRNRSAQSIYKAIRNGHLPAQRYFGRIVVRRDDVLAYDRKPGRRWPPAKQTLEQAAGREVAAGGRKAE